MGTNASQLVDIPLRESAQIPLEVLAICRRAAYELYKGRNYSQAEIVCRGLVAADHLDWYHYSLLSACLQKQGRMAEALAQVEEGLAHSPEHERLLALHTAIVRSAERVAGQGPEVTGHLSSGSGSPVRTVHAPHRRGAGELGEARCRLVLAERQRQYHRMLAVVTELARDEQAMQQQIGSKVRV